LIHLCFDAMVGLGTLMLLAGFWCALAYWRRRALPNSRLFWRLGLLCGPAAVIAMECGWIVTEVGRQPWVVYQRLKTADAVTANNVLPTLTGIVILYAGLGVGTILLLRAMSRRWRAIDAQNARVISGPMTDQILDPVRWRRR
jgi:cytochrome d ubiquinol oxidase subunit I